MINLHYETGRLKFVEDRDGVAAATAYAARMQQIYAAAARDRRRKHGKHDEYYYKFVESAASFRYLLRQRTAK